MKKSLETRTFKKVFTEDELTELAKDMIPKTQALKKAEQEKHETISKANEKYTKAKRAVNALSDKLANGFEETTVVCDVEYDTPEEGKKTLTRPDNGDTLIEDMTEGDVQAAQ